MSGERGMCGDRISGVGGVLLICELIDGHAGCHGRDLTSWSRRSAKYPPDQFLFPFPHFHLFRRSPQ